MSKLPEGRRGNEADERDGVDCWGMQLPVQEAQQATVAHTRLAVWQHRLGRGSHGSSMHNRYMCNSLRAYPDHSWLLAERPQQQLPSGGPLIISGRAFGVVI